MNEKLKSKIIQIINDSKDEKLLEQVYNILDSNYTFSSNQLFENLNEEQKSETHLSLLESANESSLEDHEDVMKEIRLKFGWS